MTLSDSDAGPTVEEARATLTREVQRLGKATALCLSGLLLAITAIELLRLYRLIESAGFGELWREGFLPSSMRDVLLLPVFAVVAWYGAPRVVAFSYGPLMSRGRLVRATVVAGPHAITERARLHHTPLAGVEALLGTVLPTRIVNYRIEGTKTSLLGAMYADESLGPDPGACWALTTPEPAGRANWLYRRRSTDGRGRR